MSSPFSLPLRLSSPPPIVNFTEVHDNSSFEEFSEAPNVDSQVSLSPFAEEVSEAPVVDSSASLPQSTSEAQNDINSRRIWDGTAGRAWFEEVIAVRNTYQLYNLPWNHRHWKEVSGRLRKRGFDRHWKVIKSYYHNRKVKWNDRCTLLDQSGFGIDGEGKVSVADSVWDKFVEVSIYFRILLY